MLDASVFASMSGVAGERPMTMCGQHGAAGHQRHPLGQRGLEDVRLSLRLSDEVCA